jgi:hypothetical protein
MEQVDSRIARVRREKRFQGFRISEVTLDGLDTVLLLGDGRGDGRGDDIGEEETAVRRLEEERGCELLANEAGSSCDEDDF